MWKMFVMMMAVMGMLLCSVGCDLTDGIADTLAVLNNAPDIITEQSAMLQAASTRLSAAVAQIQELLAGL